MRQYCCPDEDSVPHCGQNISSLHSNADKAGRFQVFEFLSPGSQNLAARKKRTGAAAFGSLAPVQFAVNVLTPSTAETEGFTNRLITPNYT
jgi:hypothetical protein